MTTKELSDEALAKSARIIGLSAVLIGTLIALLSNRAVPSISWIVGLIGLGVMGLGIVIAIYGAEFGRAYVENKRISLVEEVVEQAILEDRKGIVWVWVVAITTWAIMAVAYFALSMVVYMVIDQVEANYSFAEEQLGVLTLTKNVTGWFLIIMTIGILGWALINSARRETATYPI